MISAETINKIVRTLVEAAAPTKVILFGSYARGDARDDSDLDLLIVEPSVASEDQAIGLHAQQTVEKCLKAVLSAHQIAFRKTHDLVELIDLLRDKGERCRLTQVRHEGEKGSDPSRDNNPFAGISSRCHRGADPFSPS